MHRHFGKRIAIGLLAFLAFGLIVMLLWNALIPQIFGAAAIGYLQAIGLLVLCRVLFGGFGMPGMMMHRRHGSFRERWHKMNPEEREKFFARRGSPFGCGEGEDDDGRHHGRPERHSRFGGGHGPHFGRHGAPFDHEDRGMRRRRRGHDNAGRRQQPDFENETPKSNPDSNPENREERE